MTLRPPGICAVFRVLAAAVSAKGQLGRPGIAVHRGAVYPTRIVTGGAGSPLVICKRPCGTTKIANALSTVYIGRCCGRL